MDSSLEEKWAHILDLRYDITKALEIARQDKQINHSLTATIDLYVSDQATYAFLADIGNLAEIVIVSELKIHQKKPLQAQVGKSFPGVKIVVSSAPGSKCERCWMYSEEVGIDAEHRNFVPLLGCSKRLKETLIRLDKA